MLLVLVFPLLAPEMTFYTACWWSSGALEQTTQWNKLIILLTNVKLLFCQMTWCNICDTFTPGRARGWHACWCMLPKDTLVRVNSDINSIFNMHDIGHITYRAWRSSVTVPIGNTPCICRRSMPLGWWESWGYLMLNHSLYQSACRWSCLVLLGCPLLKYRSDGIATLKQKSFFTLLWWKQ